jgi:hypothetical protein
VAEVFVLALGSAIWPMLLAVVVVALRSPRPARVLSFFLAGSLITTVSVGLLVVFVLQRSIVHGERHPTVGPVVDLIVGSLVIVGAHLVPALLRRRRRQPALKRSARGAGWVERMLSRGAPLALVVGVGLNILPGVLPVVALKDVAELAYGTVATFALVVVFYLVMFTPVEVPLLGYVVAPAQTSAAVDRFNRWLARDGRRILVVCLDLIGVVLIVQGIVGLT